MSILISNKSKKSETHFLFLNLILTVFLTLSFPLNSFGLKAKNDTTPNVLPNLVQNVQAMDMCFSPQEACDVKLAQFISSANKSIDIAIYNITLMSVSKAIQEAYKKGIKVRIVVDEKQSDYKNSLVPELKQNGIPLKFGTTNGLMHNKYTIIDNQWIQTGSFNYTVSATNYNDENQIYIYDPRVASIFSQKFELLWQAAH